MMQRKKKLSFTLLIFIFLICSNASAQVYDFGDIPDEHLLMVFYENDSTASAVVLFDVGNSAIRYQNSRGFRLNYTRHKRIKVLEDAGVHLADVSISFRHDDPEQQIKNVKATSYTIVENDIIVEQSISSEDIFTEKDTPFWSDLKFSVPGVKKGSIIEISYEMEMDFLFWYPNWYFQSTIPTIWSEYTTRIPEYFVFAYQTKGYEQLFIENSKPYSARMGSDFQTGKELNFAMKDIPALPDEPFIRSREEYEARLELQFTRVQVPGWRTLSYLRPWDDIINDLLRDSDFGRKLKSNDDIKKEVDYLTYSINSDVEKMKNIYNHVIEKLDWNGYFGLFLNDNTAKIYSEARGNGTEINMVLMQMLKYAGLTAYPLITSTHSNGPINTLLGTIDQFNHTLVYVDVGEQAFILDATNKYRPYNLLPENVVGTQGLLVYEEQVIWLPIENYVQNSTMKTMILTLSEEGYVGSLSARNTGYFAKNLRQDYEQADSLNSLQNLIFGSGSLNEVSAVNGVLDGDEDGFTYQIKFSKTDELLSDVMYFNPMLIDGVEENPFKLKDRFFPVDFIYPFQKMVSMNITIPNGWVVEELPKPIIYRLPENSAEFQRIMQESNGSILMRYILKINKTRFLPSEYAGLQDLYINLVNTHAENIVLKKAS